MTERMGTAPCSSCLQESDCPVTIRISAARVEHLCYWCWEGLLNATVLGLRPQNVRTGTPDAPEDA